MTFIIGQKNKTSASPQAGVSSKASWNKSSDMRGFKADVLEASQKMPVIAYFWSNRIPQAQELSDNLEKIITEYQGAIGLVKLQAEDCMPLLSQLQAQSLPAVYIFHHGQIIDGFNGILPETELKTFVQALFGLPDVNVETLLTHARQQRYAHTFEEASLSYQQILEKDADNLEALSGLAHCFIRLNQVEKAETILSSLTEAKRQKSEVKSVVEHLNLWTIATESFTLQTNGMLFEQIEEQQKIYHQAVVDFFENKEESAMKSLLSLIIKYKDWSDGKAHRTLVCMFDVLGFQHPLVQIFRGRLASILFS